VIWILNFHIFICKCYCIGCFQKSSAGMGFYCKAVSSGICCYGHNGLSSCYASFWIQSQLVEKRSKPRIPLQCLDGCGYHGSTCSGRFFHIHITSISMNDNRNYSSIFMLEEGIDMYVLFCLREFQGSVLNLLMEFSSKSPEICCRVMNILVEVAEFWILLVFLGCFLWSFWELDNAICYPLVKNSHHLFQGIRNRRWWLLKRSFEWFLSLVVYSGHHKNLRLAFLFFRLFGMRLADSAVFRAFWRSYANLEMLRFSR
jgi:hypothetical protein